MHVDLDISLRFLLPQTGFGNRTVFFPFLSLSLKLDRVKESLKELDDRFDKFDIQYAEKEFDKQFVDLSLEQS